MKLKVIKRMGRDLLYFIIVVVSGICLINLGYYFTETVITILILSAALLFIFAWYSLCEEDIKKEDNKDKE